MTETRPQHRAADASKTEKSAAAPFVQFDFLRLESRFHTLQSNEKLVARQEFLAAVESLQRQSTAHTYALTGLRADCDLLVWRHAANLEILQASSERLRGSGLGKYLTSAHSFLTLASAAEAPPEGRGKYLFVQPAAWTREMIALPHAKRQEAMAERLRLAAKHPDLTMRVFESFGVEGHRCLIGYETDIPQSYVQFQHELENSALGAHLEAHLPVFPCIRKDIRDIVEGME